MKKKGEILENSRIMMILLVNKEAKVSLIIVPIRALRKLLFILKTRTIITIMRRKAIMMSILTLRLSLEQ